MRAMGPSDYIARCTALSRKRAFATKAIHKLALSDPDTVAVFRQIGRQVSLTKKGDAEVQKQLALTAAQNELWRQGKTPDLRMTKLSFPVETAESQAIIEMKREKGKWLLSIRELEGRELV